MTQEVFLSFLRPIKDRFSDADVNEIRINPNGTVYEERRGKVARVEVVMDRDAVEFAVGSLAGAANRPINQKHPKLDVRLEDGSRIAILGPPLVPWYAVTIRRFPRSFTFEQYVENRTMTVRQSNILSDAIRERKTILVSGGTASGKTTLARTLMNTIAHPGDRLVLIEDPSELNLDHAGERDIVAIETHEASEHFEAFTPADAVRAALRHSPGRLFLGELRGTEAINFLEACNTGHTGSLTTIHANSAQDAFERLTMLVRRADHNLPLDVIAHMISRAVDVAAHMHLDRATGCRVLTEILRVAGVDGNRIRTEAIQ